MREGLRYGLMMMTAAFAAVFSAYASSPEETIDSIHNRLTLQEVEVVGERGAAGVQALPLDGEIRVRDLVSLPVQTVADIIKYCAGVDVRTRGASGAQADISMRGGTFDQVRILLNGIDITDAQTGHYSMNLPLSADLITGIIVQDNTINILTRAPFMREKGTSLRFTTGMNGLVNPAVSTRHSWGDVYLHTSVEYNCSDGYYAPNPSKKEQVALDNSDLHLANIYVQTGYKGLDVQLGAQYKDAGSGMFYGFGSQDQFDATRTGFAAARYKHHWNDAWQLEANASYRANYDHYEWHRGQPLGSNTHLSQIAGALLKGSYSYNLGETALGVEMRNENLHSSNMGDHNRLNVNYFAEQHFRWNDIHANLDVHGNFNTMFGHDVAGKAKIGYALRHWDVYLKGLRSFRLPTFTDLYYDAGNQLGNPNLQPEKAWTLALEGGYSSPAGDTNGPLTVRAEAFYRWGWNIIDWVYTPTDLKRPYHAENQARVNAAGTELSARYELKESVFLRKAEVSYAYTWLDLDVDRSGSRYLDYLSHKLVARVEHYLCHLPHSELCAAWSLTWQKREGQFNTAEGDVASFKPVLLLDGQIFWEYSGIKVAAECTNMTNRHYYDYGGVLQPGAWAKLTISANLASLARSLK